MRPEEYISRLLHACVMNVTQMGRCNNAVTRPVPEISARENNSYLNGRHRTSAPSAFARERDTICPRKLRFSFAHRLTYLFSFPGKEVFSRVNNLDDIARLSNFLSD